MAPIRNFVHRYCSALSRRRLGATLGALLVIVSLSMTAACGDDASSSDVPDASSQDGAPAIDAANPVDAGEAPDADPKAPDAGSLCGGFSGAQCSDQEFCDYPDNECGSADGAGTCMPRPEACLPVIDEVCGCDGRRYDNECDAYRAGTDVATSANCQ